ncbi:hypothetical protein [Desertimonas flava]|jgi:hypothetical protein|uniref:hypothetical protein n=1 Tax=Desertimonas flava TaxID=2064846 RepID=UPI000E344686|nr:hypothetical protein [Desertimonas flava]
MSNFATRRRPATVLVDVLAAIGLVVTVVAVLVGASAALDLVDRARRAFGGSPPSDGIDWVTLAAMAVIVLVIAAALLGAQRLVMRRHRRRLAAVLGPGVGPLGRGPRAGLDREQWLAALLTAPGWADTVAEWRRTGAIAADLAVPTQTIEDRAVVAELIAGELSGRIGARSLATGLAVAAARSRVGDAAAVVAGSVEIQLDALATLGLQPTARTYLRIARSAAAGITAASYLDIEDRLELDLAVRAAVYGLEAAGDAADLADEAISDDLADALGEVLTSGGGTVGTLLGLVGGAFGVSGSILRQVADVSETIGGQVTEGLVIAALLHHQGMTLVAETVADDADLRRRLTPTAGRVPRELFDAAVAVARRYRGELRRLLRDRATRAAKSAPRRMSPFKRRDAT